MRISVPVNTPASALRSRWTNRAGQMVCSTLAVLATLLVLGSVATAEDIARDECSHCRDIKLDCGTDHDYGFTAEYCVVPPNTKQLAIDLAELEGVDVVTKIDWSDKVQGELPDLSVDFPMLEEFDCDHCFVNNSEASLFWPWMANFKHLTRLSLKKTRRSGSIADDVDLSGSVKTLKHLALSDWEGSYDKAAKTNLNPGTPDWLANFSFTHLDFSNANFRIDLGELDLTGSKNTLERLYLDGNTDLRVGPVPKWLSSFTQLTVLSLRNTRRNGLLSHVGKILKASTQTLRSVDLRFNKFVPGPIPAWVRDFQLDNGGCQLSFTARYYGNANGDVDMTNEITRAVRANTSPVCPDNYEGDRCQTCRGCAEGLACSTTFPSTDVGECFAPQDLAGAYGLGLKTINFKKTTLGDDVPSSEKKKLQNPWYTISQQTPDKDIPDVAAHFPDLEVLECRGCTHLPPGPVYNWISNFANLKTLVLQSANRNGNLRTADLKSRGNPTLTTLILNGNQYRTPTNPGFVVGPLPAWMNDFAWSELSLKSTMLSGDMEQMQLSNSYATMRTLDLSSNWDFEPGPFPSWIANFRQLSVLDLTYTKRIGDISHVDDVLQKSKSLGAFTKIAIADNPFTPGPIPAWLRKYSTTVEFKFEKTRRYGVRRANSSTPDVYTTLDADVDQDAVAECGKKVQRREACPASLCDGLYTGDRCQTCKACGVDRDAEGSVQPGVACAKTFQRYDRLGEVLGVIDTYMKPSDIDFASNYCVIPQDLRSAFGEADDVQALDLSDSNLVGILPNIADVYPNLLQLNVNNNPLLAPGQLWRWLSTFSALEELSVARSRRIGSMHASETAYLENMQGSLKILNMGNNMFAKEEFPAWLSKFTALQQVNLQRTERIGDLGLVNLAGSASTLEVLLLNDNLGIEPGPMPAWLRGFAKEKKVFVGEYAANVYTSHPPGTGVGQHGGECTCPNGQVYLVGDYANECGSLACEGGTITKACSPYHPVEGHHKSLTCGQATNGLSNLNIYGLADVDGSSDSIAECAAAVVRGESCERKNLCDAGYEGERCESCKTCRVESLMCGGFHAAIEFDGIADRETTIAVCKVPPGIVAAVGSDVTELDFSNSSLIDAVPDMSSLPRLSKLDVSHNPLLTKDQEWGWAGETVTLNLYNSNQKVSFGDKCSLDGLAECGGASICRTHCCLPDVDANSTCSFCDNEGKCFDELTTTVDDPASAWDPSIIDAWKEEVMDAEMLLNRGEAKFIGAPDGSIIGSLIRGPLPGSGAQYVVRWSHTGSTDPMQNHDRTVYNPSDMPIGGHPPPGLIDSGKGADPGRFYVDQTDGSIIAGPSKNGTYSMWLIASLVDTEESDSIERGLPSELEEVLVAHWTVTVQEKGKFFVQSWENYSPETVAGASIEFDKPVAADNTYAVGEVYYFKPIRIMNAMHVSGRLEDIKFTLEGEPFGFLINPRTGFVQGQSLVSERFDMNVYAVDTNGDQALVRNVTMNFKEKDTDNDANGPDGKGCNGGVPMIDNIPFDKAFTCNCSDITGESDKNCVTTDASPSAVPSNSPVVGGVLGGLIVVALLLAALFKYKEYKHSLIAHDFKATLEAMAASGEIDQALLDKGITGEATVMAMVPPHPNVLALIGCVTSGLPKMLVVPVCELGSMLSFVQDRAKGPKDQQLQIHDKIVMAHDVAKGMAHLIASSFVHRDLAARNVLVNSMYVCRVADFDEVWNNIFVPCFAFEPADRPTFDELVVMLSRLESYPMDDVEEDDDKPAPKLSITGEVKEVVYESECFRHRSASSTAAGDYNSYAPAGAGAGAGAGAATAAVAAQSKKKEGKKNSAEPNYFGGNESDEESRDNDGSDGSNQEAGAKPTTASSMYEYAAAGQGADAGADYIATADQTNASAMYAAAGQGANAGADYIATADQTNANAMYAAAGQGANAGADYIATADQTNANAMYAAYTASVQGGGIYATAAGDQTTAMTENPSAAVTGDDEPKYRPVYAQVSAGGASGSANAAAVRTRRVSKEAEAAYEAFQASKAKDDAADPTKDGYVDIDTAAELGGGYLEVGQNEEAGRANERKMAKTKKKKTKTKTKTKTKKPKGKAPKPEPNYFGGNESDEELPDGFTKTKTKKPKGKAPKPEPNYFGGNESDEELPDGFGDGDVEEEEEEVSGFAH
eukprot:gene4694-30163_t